MKKITALLLALIMLLSLTPAFAQEGDEDMMTIQITSAEESAVPFAAAAGETALEEVAVREAAYVPYGWDGAGMSPLPAVRVYTVTVPEGVEKVTLTFGENCLAYNYMPGDVYLAGEYADPFTGAAAAEVAIDANEDGVADYVQVQTPYDPDTWATTTVYAVTFAAPALKAAVPFCDLDAEWYDAGVRYAYAEELMQGVGGDRFAPLGVVTCAEVAAVLYRLAGSPAVETAEDVWYAAPVAWAQANGFVSEEQEALGVLSRQELCVMLYRYLQSRGEGFTGAWMLLLGFEDRADVDEAAYEAVCYLWMKGVVQGKPGNLFDPNGTLTRGELATVLQRMATVE